MTIYRALVGFNPLTGALREDDNSVIQHGCLVISDDNWEHMRNQFDGYKASSDWVWMFVEVEVP